MKTTKLSSSVTLEQYLGFRTTKDTTSIADLIAERFKERYIEPFENNPAKHGFSMMAVSCLLIEVLNAFKKGWKRTGVKGSVAFEGFFEDSNHLKEFKDIFFYRDIRCGILHQAETYNGWRILRKGDLLDKSSKVINAQKFFCNLNKELDDYISLLKAESFTSPIWRKALRKLDHISENCS